MGDGCRIVIWAIHNFQLDVSAVGSHWLHWLLQAQPATLAALVGALGAAKLGSAQRARARPAFTDAGLPEPPAVSHARPAWAAPLAAAVWDAAAAPADLAVPLEPRCVGMQEYLPCAVCVQSFGCCGLCKMQQLDPRPGCYVE